MDTNRPPGASAGALTTASNRPGPKQKPSPVREGLQNHGIRERLPRIRRGLPRRGRRARHALRSICRAKKVHRDSPSSRVEGSMHPDLPRRKRISRLHAQNTVIPLHYGAAFIVHARRPGTSSHRYARMHLQRAMLPTHTRH